jgi:hypothetical protein
MTVVPDCIGAAKQALEHRSAEHQKSAEVRGVRLALFVGLRHPHPDALEW